MGRAFEKRKHTIFARMDRVAKQFTKVGKDIAIAVKSGGTSPEGNPALRRALQNARALNMPKEKVEAAIKKASGHGAANYDVILYEGYGRLHRSRVDTSTPSESSAAQPGASAPVRRAPPNNEAR